MARFPVTIATIAVRGISHSFGNHLVLNKVSFTLGPEDRIGIVGPNGAGKSTLLRIIAGQQTPEAGSVSPAPANATIGYLPQIADRRDESVNEFLARRTGVASATSALDDASDLLAQGADGSDDIYANALDAYMSLGAPDFDARIGEICNQVGLPARVVALPMTALSGGQVARTSLAALLLSRFDVYLLDEPTNDLDFAGLDHLERFVTTTEAGMLIVSHDRTFLTRTITSVLEIDGASHEAAEYTGTWRDYLNARSVARSHAEEAYATNQSQRAALKSRAQKQKQWIDAGLTRQKNSPDDNDKLLRKRRIENTEKQSSKISASERALERLETVAKPWEGWELHLDFLAGPRSGDVVARLSDAVVTLGDFVLGPIDLEINWADRIAITGPNGSGKTTLLRSLLGRIALTSGEQHLGPGVILGEIDQAREVLESARPLVEAFSDYAGVLPQETRSLLAKFDLPATHVQRSAGSLSPGERTRATLALLMARGTNCLVLDEPTNHLDLEAIEQLEGALDRFEGTVLLITHDREFLEKARITRRYELG